MTNFNPEMTGVLFREWNKKNPKGPDMTGKMTLKGVEYRLAGWTKEGKGGHKFLSLKLTPPKDEYDQSQPQPIADDDIPF